MSDLPTPPEGCEWDGDSLVRIAGDVTYDLGISGLHGDEMRIDADAPQCNAIVFVPSEMIRCFVRATGCYVSEPGMATAVQRAIDEADLLRNVMQGLVPLAEMIAEANVAEDVHEIDVRELVANILDGHARLLKLREGVE